MSIDINASDVIRLIEQYLKENNLFKTLSVLQEETRLPYAAVENLESFLQDIVHGNWDVVLQTLSFTKLPFEKLIIVYEQIFLELLELKEINLARLFLRQMEPFNYLKENDPNRYIKFEHLLGLPISSIGGGVGLYSSLYGPDTNREKRRSEISQYLAKEISIIPSSRLLTLLHQALQYQQSHGLIPKNGPFDLLYEGSVKITESSLSHLQPPSTCYATLQFEKESCPQSALFTPDGEYFITGTADGFIEVWDYRTGKLREDLPYQTSEGGGLVMDTAVYFLSVNKGGDLLASGSESGDIIIWHIKHGQILMKYIKAHSGGISSIVFSRDNSQLLTTGYDKIIRIFGLKTTQPLKEFHGHLSFVNCAIFTPDPNRIMSSCSDGTIKIWDIKSADCLMTITPRRDLNILGSSLMNVPIYNLIRIPKKDLFIVVCRSPVVPIISSHGLTIEVLKPSDSKADFIAGALSYNGLIYMAVAEDHYMYTFDLSDGSVINKIKVTQTEMIGICQHPSTNILAFFSRDGLVQFWK